MTKLKTFARTFYLSLSDFNYYHDLLTAKFSFALKYLFFLLFLLAIIQSVKISISVFSFSQKTPQLVEQLKTGAQDFYPQELILNLKDGELTTNVKEPYFIDLPQSWNLTNLKGFHLIAIDTNGRVEDFKDYKSGMLLTKKTLVVPDENSSFRAISLSEIKENYKIDKDLYQKTIAAIFPYLDKLPELIKWSGVGLFFLLPLILSFFQLSWLTTYLLFTGLLLWLFGKIAKTGRSYGEIYKLSMVGLTLPILFDFVSSLIGFHLSYVYTFLFLLWMGIVIIKLKENKSTFPS